MAQISHYFDANTIEKVYCKEIHHHHSLVMQIMYVIQLLTVDNSIIQAVCSKCKISAKAESFSLHPVTRIKTK